MQEECRPPGKVIKVAEGNAQLKKYRELITEAGDDDEARQLFLKIISKHNAFLFHADHVARFFKNGEVNEKTHFMVAIGIKNPDERTPELFTPTVMVWACNKEEYSGNIAYRTMAGLDLSEHPDGKSIEVIEDPRLHGELLFKLSSE